MDFESVLAIKMVHDQVKLEMKYPQKILEMENRAQRGLNPIPQHKMNTFLKKKTFIEEQATSPRPNEKDQEGETNT
jgi:hypothetical protein